MKTIITIITFILCMGGFLYLDNAIVNYCLADVTAFHNLLSIILWIVLLSFSGGITFVISLLITAFVRAILN